MKKLIATSLAVLIGGAVLPHGLLAQLDLSPPVRIPDVVFVPTPQPVVEAMLELAKVKPDEMVYDLGCGDGRVVITAARDFGARGIGVDIDPGRVQESRANAWQAGVRDRVQFRQADLFEMDFSDADVVFLYLLPALNVRLRPRLLDELKPGTRVVSHAFSMGEWDSDKTVQVNGAIVHFWVIPARVAGEWKVTLPGGEPGTLSLEQKFQKVTGRLKTNHQSWPLTDVRLEGPTLTFSFGNRTDVRRATAKIDGGKLTGTVQRGATGPGEAWSGELSR